jgi:hypothetical protein
VGFRFFCGRWIEPLRTLKRVLKGIRIFEIVSNYVLEYLFWSRDSLQNIQFEGSGGFEGPCELIVAVGV